MSNLSRAMISPKALREWCRVTCAHYPNVEIKNMSTSFRDGLAFCAIIHRHRPDLIDFSSLSKDNVFQNNKLAFEIAETKLGIPALLDPNDMTSSKVPDCLSVITYLSQYYYFFNRKCYGLASSRSSHVTILNSLTKSSTNLETSREDRLANTRPKTVCRLCFKPVHLIQRHWIDGKVYHRSCFRCKVCRSTLLPGSYTQGSEAGSKSSHRVFNQQIGSADSRPKRASQTGHFSLGGLAITTVPHYAKKTESQDRLVGKTAETEGRDSQERSREVKDGLQSIVRKPARSHLPPPSVKDRAIEEAGKAGPAAILADSKTEQEVTEGSSRPVPAPRRMLGSSVVPVPAPRTKTSQETNSSSAAGTSSQSSPHITSPKVKTNHPWLAIVHPGPWTQLPPAPAPVPTPRSKSVSNLHTSWYRPKVAAPNPFGEDVDDVTQDESTADQTTPSEAGNEGNLSGVTNTVDGSSEPAGDTNKIGVLDLDVTGNTGGSLSDVTEAAAAAAGPHATSDGASRHILPRSLSVPAITSAPSQGSPVPADMTEAGDQVTPCQTKLACKENPFDRKPAIPKSKSFQVLPSRRAPAPGHGFPLIKRKVQTDQNISTENLQVEMRELDKHLEAMEQRGVELERNLRDCKNDKEEEQMLMEWFSLIHEKQVLVRRDTELVFLTKQQKLEERQADVEYELRCLLNKPESDWSQKDRDQEQQHMDELVAIIEQRNQIISSLDQDRLREREEDMLLEAMMKNKELQKEELKELKKSKGKFKPTKVLKMLNHRAESTKDSMDKKS
ncbi:MICAL-like protein 1 isoform X2 [Sparus aurata]|uniref:MICAL-like protein 1 isoform X2 n=1 Tax=Sparus aurata TaxID=8175 RepID=UPI0011C171C9|nr:MICAL-like protein 1 isoform X2 [Sparus aurata]